VIKNICITLFLDQEQYNSIREIAFQRKITFKSDSEMIRKALYDYTERILKIAMDQYLQKGEIAKKDSIIQDLRDQTVHYQQDLERLQENLKIQSEKRKKMR
jgi:Arc/MetJ-type ribon-helix-helix transcriptional regulator